MNSVLAWPTLLPEADAALYRRTTASPKPGSKGSLPLLVLGVAWTAPLAEHLSKPFDRHMMRAGRLPVLEAGHNTIGDDNFSISSNCLHVVIVKGKAHCTEAAEGVAS